MAFARSSRPPPSANGVRSRDERTLRNRRGTGAPSSPVYATIIGVLFASAALTMPLTKSGILSVWGAGVPPVLTCSTLTILPSALKVNVN